MEILFVYLAKASGLLTLFLLSYYLFIKQETFFNSSRFFLIGGILTSALLPLLGYTKIVWVDPVLQQEPLMIQQNPIDVPVAIAAPVEAFEVNWWFVAVLIYITGVLFFVIRLLTDLYRINLIVKSGERTLTNRFNLIDSPTVTSPFSFFRYIVYNSALLSPDELKNIIAHEKVHSRQLHSLDMLLNQLMCALLWFNPISWMYKKQVAQNLEFIADAEAAKRITDIKAYQRTLLKITLQPECIAITNHFYQSLIKKRIIMLNKQKSKKANLIKFAFIIPLVAVFFYFFQTEVLAQERENKITEQDNTGKKANPENEIAYGSEITYPTEAITTISKDLTDKVMKERAAMYKDIFEADVQFKNVKRNKNGEITSITVLVKDEHHQKNYPVYESISDNGTAIATFTLTIERDSKESRNKITFQKSEHNEISETTTTSTEDSEAENEMSAPLKYINSRMKDRDVIVIINGEIQTSKYIIEPLGEKFETIIELDAKTTLKKYNVKTKDGAIVLTTKKIDNAVSSYSSSISRTGVGNNSYEIVGNNVSNNTKNRTTTATVRTVTVTTLADKDGRIIENNTPETTYYTVNKNSTNVQLNTFKEDLEKAGMTIEYSDIVRNTRGIITAINIKLADKSNLAKTSASWETDRNSDGIPNIYIGKIQGRLTVSSAQ